MAQTKKTTSKNEHTVTFQLEHDRDTKGAERFAEVPEDGHLRTAYFRKELFKELGISKPEEYDVEMVATFRKKS